LNWAEVNLERAVLPEFFFCRAGRRFDHISSAMHFSPKPRAIAAASGAVRKAAAAAPVVASILFPIAKSEAAQMACQSGKQRLPHRVQALRYLRFTFGFIGRACRMCERRAAALTYRALFRAACGKEIAPPFPAGFLFA
jgi:hypothetical protein